MFSGANDIIMKAIKFADIHAKLDSNNAINAIGKGVRSSLFDRAATSPELRKRYMKPAPKYENGKILKDKDGNIQYDDKATEFAPTDWELAQSLLRDRQGDLHVKRVAAAGAMPILGVAGIVDILD